jgi:hypothetical protein
MKKFKSFRSYFEEDGAGGAAVGGGTGAVAANVTGDSPTMAMPASANPMGLIRRRKYRQFEVESATFNKFSRGRMRFERWSKYLDLGNERHNEIYNYARNNRDHVIVLKDSVTGALRAIRRRSANE